MKSKLIVPAFICILLAASSCKKDSTTPTPPSPKYPIEGLWIGTQTVDNDPTSTSDNYYSLVIYENGSILTKGKGSDGNTYYASGTWSLSSSNIFTATITTLLFNGPAVTQAFTFTFSDVGLMTDGKWKDTVNGTQVGHFSIMKRVN